MLKNLIRYIVVKWKSNQQITHLNAKLNVNQAKTITKINIGLTMSKQRLTINILTKVHFEICTTCILSLKLELYSFLSKYTLAVSMATRLIQQKAKNQHIHFSVSVREVFKTFDITQVEITSVFFLYII